MIDTEQWLPSFSRPTWCLGDQASPVGRFRLPHAGTRSRYAMGCRGDGCTAEAALAHKVHRRRNGMPPKKLGRTHGRIGTYNGGCRCAACRRAAADAKAAWRRRRSAAA